MDIGRRTRRLSKRFPKMRVDMFRELKAKPFLEDSWYSVVDFETTGVGKSDRVIEIAVVRFTGDGTGSDEWSTLINPGRDLGGYRIHRVNRFGYVRHAPRFEDVAGDLCARLKGTVLCAHNLTFERRFLDYEYKRLGIQFPVQPGICTLRLGSALGTPCRRLEDACSQFGILIDRGHSALGDAWATARLLAVYLTAAKLNGIKTLDQLGVYESSPPEGAWPAFGPSGRALPRGEAEAKYGHEEDEGEEPNYLARLAGRLPNVMAEAEAEYVNFLDRVMGDFEITASEAEELQSFARASGIPDGRTEAIHAHYVEEMVLAAWEDGVVTQQEKHHIYMLADLLGVPRGMAADLVAKHRPGGPG